MEFKHKSVLLEESIQALNLKDGGKYIDGTLGGAGHSLEIIKRMKSGMLIGIDRDKEALNIASKRLQENNPNNIELRFFQTNFSNIPGILEDNNIGKVDGILLDLGVSSYQIDNPERGFSYMADGLLDMRMNQEDKLTAKEIVNNYSEDELVNIFYKYGEEKFSRRIAKEIILERKQKEINTTQELVHIIDRVVPFSKKSGHKAKRVFQALRIEVNGELAELEKTIKELIKCLNKEGRLSVITFHSLEDKIVKSAMVEMEGRCTCPKDLPVCVCNKVSYGNLLKRKSIKPNKEELENNSRSKSAQLRVFVKE